MYEKIIKSGKCDGVNDSPKDKHDCLYNGGRGEQGKPENMNVIISYGGHNECKPYHLSNRGL